MQTHKWYAQTKTAQILDPPDPETQFYYCIDKIKDCKKEVIDKEKSTIDKVVKKTITAKYNFSIDVDDPNAKFIKYRINLKFGETGSVIEMTSNTVYESKEIAEKTIKNWITRLKKSNKKDAPDNQAPLFKPLLKPWLPIKGKKAKKYQSILSDPYSFILTVVIPKWPVRFQEKGFKKALERAIQSECPAHLFPNILWLNKNKFQQYQSLHFEWWNAYLNEEPDAYGFRKELMDCILKHSFPKSLWKKKKKKKKKKSSSKNPKSNNPPADHKKQGTK